MKYRVKTNKKKGCMRRYIIQKKVLFFWKNTDEVYFNVFTANIACRGLNKDTGKVLNYDLY